MHVKAVVFDRDGTLVEHVPYVSDPGEIRVLPGVVDGIRALKTAGLRLFVHTNQSGVGRGMFDLAQVEQCNQRMLELIGQGDDVFDEIRIAPEHPSDPPQFRKPSSRYAKELSARLEIGPPELCYVGDRASDLQTAAAAGTGGIGVRTGRGDLDAELVEVDLAGRYPICDSFDEVVKLLLGNDNGQ